MTKLVRSIVALVVGLCLIGTTDAGAATSYKVFARASVYNNKTFWLQGLYQYGQAKGYDFDVTIHCWGDPEWGDPYYQGKATIRAYSGDYASGTVPYYTTTVTKHYGSATRYPKTIYDQTSVKVSFSGYNGTPAGECHLSISWNSRLWAASSTTPPPIHSPY